MSREREESDATGTTNDPKRSKEGCANSLASLIYYNASDAEASAFAAKLARTRCLSVEDALVSLQPVIRDLTLQHLCKVVKVYDLLKDKIAAVSKLTPSGEPNDRSHFPSSLKKFKFELTGSDRVKGDQRFAQLADECREMKLAMLDRMAEKCLSAARLEMEGLYTELRTQFFVLAMRIAGAVLKAYLATHGTWRSDLSARDLAGCIVRQMLESVMKDEQFGRLGLSRAQSRDDLINKLFVRGLRFPKDEGDVMDLSITVEGAKVTHDMLNSTFFALFDNIDEKQRVNDYTKSLQVDFAVDVQQRANEDVIALLDQEMDAEEPRMEQVIQDRVDERVAAAEAKLQAEVRQLKQQMRAKGTGGVPDQRSTPKSNGQGKKGASTNSSEEGTANPNRRRRPNRRRGGRGKGNPGGSRNGGAGRGSERS